MVSWHNWNAKPAFEGLNPDDYEHDPPGFWRQFLDPMWEQSILLARPKIIVEVGSFRGISALTMADVVMRHNLETKIICVDTWIGSPEHWIGHDYWNVKTKFGFPTLYYAFAANVVQEGFQNIIVPLPSTSDSGAYILKQAGITSEMISIDAAHEYEPALRDYNAYWDLLTQDGVLIGDDYLGPGWESVTKAADDFSASIGVPLTARTGRFIMNKGNAGIVFDDTGAVVRNS